MVVVVSKTFKLVKLNEDEVPGEDDCGHCCFLKNNECFQPDCPGFGCNVNNEVGYYWTEEVNVNPTEK